MFNLYPLFEKFLLSPEGQRAARLVIHQGLHLLVEISNERGMGTMGAKRIRGLLQKHSLSTGFETRIARFM